MKQKATSLRITTKDRVRTVLQTKSALIASILAEDNQRGILRNHGGRVTPPFVNLF